MMLKKNHFTEVKTKENKTRVNSQNRCVGFKPTSPSQSQSRKRAKKKPTLNFGETDSGFRRPSLLYIPTQPSSYFITCFLFFL